MPIRTPEPSRWPARSGLLRRFRNATTLFAICVFCSYVAVAAVVSMQQPQSGSGEIRIPVVLYGDGEELLSGVQFDLHYDTGSYTLVGVTGGAAAADAGKEVILSEPVSGSGRVLVTGFNNYALADGLVATIVLRPLHNNPDAYAFAMDNVLASDPQGNGVPIEYDDLFQFPPALPEKVEEAMGAEQVAEQVDAGESENTAPDEAPGGAADNESPATVDPGGESIADLLASGFSTGSPGTGRVTDGQHLEGAPQSVRGGSTIIVAPNRTESVGNGRSGSGGTAGPRSFAPAPATARQPEVRPGSRQVSPQQARAQRISDPAVAGGATNPESTLRSASEPWRLALAAPIADASAIPGSARTSGVVRMEETTFSGVLGYPGLAALGLGSLLLLGILGFRALLFGRLLRPGWRRPR